MIETQNNLFVKQQNCINYFNKNKLKMKIHGIIISIMKNDGKKTKTINWWFTNHCLCDICHEFFGENSDQKSRDSTKSKATTEMQLLRYDRHINIAYDSVL